MGRLRLLVIRDRWIVRELLCEDMLLENDIREREGGNACVHIHRDVFYEQHSLTKVDRHE